MTMVTPIRASRAEQQALTRQRLIDVALELFADQGYDQTGTEEIAAAAGVTQRTFFRHFPTKESVLFFGEYDFMRSFTGVLLAQDPSAPDLVAVRDALLVLVPGVERLRPRIAKYEAAIATSLVLRGREQHNHDEHVDEIARAIARRRGRAVPDESCRLLALVGHTVLRRSLDVWLQGPAKASLADSVAGEFALLSDLVASTVRDG